MKSSPAQRMFGRRTRTLLPTSKELLEPQLVRDVRERKLQRKEVQARYFNRNVKELPSLTKGDVVRMKPQASDGKQRWAKAQVQQQVDVRSMLLELKMAGYSEETADICDSRKNSSWLKMLMLKFQVQLQTVHQLKSTQDHQQHEHRTAEETQHLWAVRKQPRTTNYQANSIVS